MKKIPGTELTAQNIFCIGRNYAEHAKELGNSIPTEPVVFLKPTSSIIYHDDQIVIPKNRGEIHHEVEVVLVIGKTGKNIEENLAWDYVRGVGIGLDLTARDLQSKAKEKGLPWAVSKGFDTFAVLSSFIPVPAPEIRDSMKFSLLVDGVVKQSGVTSDMIFSIPKLIAFLSSVFTLSPGDLIFTGTPQGVGPIHEGQNLQARLEDGLVLNVGVCTQN
jgi:2-keto-4-pentenoate hydratase/2-oxohepta-3-ene-1,7-dioic acid hydratase in catechol pathway